MKYARLENNIVREVVDLPDGETPSQRYHIDIANKFVQCPDLCSEGWEVFVGELVPQNDYRLLRHKEYPDQSDYLDAKVKQASTDPAVQSAGYAQELAYLQACLAVKEKYPKP